MQVAVKKKRSNDISMKVRRRQSDARWRANVASCYETLKHIIPVNKRASRRQISKAVILQETHKHIDFLENMLTSLLHEKAERLSLEDQSAFCNTESEKIKTEFMQNHKHKLAQTMQERKLRQQKQVCPFSCDPLTCMSEIHASEMIVLPTPNIDNSAISTSNNMFDSQPSSSMWLCGQEAQNIGKSDEQAAATSYGTQLQGVFSAALATAAARVKEDQQNHNSDDSMERKWAKLKPKIRKINRCVEMNTREKAESNVGKSSNLPLKEKSEIMKHMENDCMLETQFAVNSILEDHSVPTQTSLKDPNTAISAVLEPTQLPVENISSEENLAKSGEKFKEIKDLQVALSQQLRQTDCDSRLSKDSQLQRKSFVRIQTINNQSGRIVKSSTSHQLPQCNAGYTKNISYPRIHVTTLRPSSQNLSKAEKNKYLPTANVLQTERRVNSQGAVKVMAKTNETPGFKQSTNSQNDISSLNPKLTTIMPKQRKIITLKVSAQKDCTNKLTTTSSQVDGLKKKISNLKVEVLQHITDENVSDQKKQTIITRKEISKPIDNLERPVAAKKTPLKVTPCKQVNQRGRHKSEISVTPSESGIGLSTPSKTSDNEDQWNEGFTPVKLPPSLLDWTPSREGTLEEIQEADAVWTTSHLICDEAMWLSDDNDDDENQSHFTVFRNLTNRSQITPAGSTSPDILSKKRKVSLKTSAMRAGKRRKVDHPKCRRSLQSSLLVDEDSSFYDMEKDENELAKFKDITHDDLLDGFKTISKEYLHDLHISKAESLASKTAIHEWLTNIREKLTSPSKVSLLKSEDNKRDADSGGIQEKNRTRTQIDNWSNLDVKETIKQNCAFLGKEICIDEIGEQVCPGFSEIEVTTSDSNNLHMDEGMNVPGQEILSENGTMSNAKGIQVIKPLESPFLDAVKTEEVTDNIAVSLVQSDTDATKYKFVSLTNHNTEAETMQLVPVSICPEMENPSVLIQISEGQYIVEHQLRSSPIFIVGSDVFFTG